AAPTAGRPPARSRRARPSRRVRRRSCPAGRWPRAARRRAPPPRRGPRSRRPAAAWPTGCRRCWPRRRASAAGRGAAGARSPGGPPRLGLDLVRGAFGGVGLAVVVTVLQRGRRRLLARDPPVLDVVLHLVVADQDVGAVAEREQERRQR